MVVYDAANDLNAKISSVLKGKDWLWKPTRYEELVSIQRKLAIFRPSWLSSKSGKYTSSKTYNYIYI